MKSRLPNCKHCGCLRTLLVAILMCSSVTAPAAGLHGRAVQIVAPGDSIQSAIDNAAPGGWIFIHPGVYRETAHATNGLVISASLNLVGLSTSRKRVVLENSGAQRNGIVAVPRDRSDCMSCHTNLAPPFDLRQGVPRGTGMRQPMIRGLSISGITVRNFTNNGLFTENVDGFLINDVESVGNSNYGIFPTLSKNGVISGSRATGAADSGIWVETSENILVTQNLAEGNVIGLEVSNSDNVRLIDNESRNNSVGISAVLLPFLFADRPGARKITIARNWVHDNNRVNDAPPGAIAADLPSGTGILVMGVDDVTVTRNRVANNNSTGIVTVDVCVALQGTPRECGVDPRVTPAFLADQEATQVRVTNNILTNNGAHPPPTPFSFAASDLTLLSFGAGNCYLANSFATSFSLLGELPPCQ